MTNENVQAEHWADWSWRVAACSSVVQVESRQAFAAAWKAAFVHAKERSALQAYDHVRRGNDIMKGGWTHKLPPLFVPASVRQVRMHGVTPGMSVAPVASEVAVVVWACAPKAARRTARERVRAESIVGEVMEGVKSGG